MQAPVPNIPPGMVMALNDQARLMAAQGQFTPIKKDGGLTVAAQNLAALSQQEAAKQAQTASGIEAMKQAQMQQELQRMLAQKAAPPVPLASGIAANTDVPMAEGGIVGYAGPDGSDVELDVSGRIKKALRDWYERTERGYMERAGATPEMIAQKLGREPSTPPESQAAEQALTSAFSPAAQQQRMRDVPQMQSRPPVPIPAAQRKPTGIAQVAAPAVSAAPTPTAPMLPDTRESTAVNPSEAALMYAQMQGGLKELLERQSKPRERTPEELKAAAAQEEEIKRRMGEIDASKARFEQAKQERLAGQQGQGLRDLASFLSRAKGPTGLAALAQAQLGMEPILAARAAQEQQFREQELVFMDKLGERRNLVNDLRLSSLKDDAGRAREDAARLRALDLEISKLGLGLGEKRAGELARAELSREEQAARLGQSREEAAARLAQAREEMASREKIARIGEGTRAAGADAREQRLALAQMKADPDYKRIQEALVAAGALAARLPNNPKYKAQLENAQREYAKLARAYGVDLKAAAPEAAAPAAVSPELLSQFKVRPVGQ